MDNLFDFLLNDNNKLDNLFDLLLNDRPDSGLWERDLCLFLAVRSVVNLFNFLLNGSASNASELLACSSQHLWRLNNGNVVNLFNFLLNDRRDSSLWE